MLFIDLSVDRREKSDYTPASMCSLFTQTGLEAVQQQPIIFSGFVLMTAGIRHKQ
jgi:hypothetical protein